MIGKLTGIIDSISEDSIILNVNGVGYLVFVPQVLLQGDIAIDSEISLFIETQVREDAITLYGFKTLEDKKMFNLLKTVQGVGAKLAIAVLSTLTFNDLQNIIMLEDHKSMQTIPGVGAKVALRITSELKDKIDKVFKGSTFISTGIKGQNNSTVGNSEAKEALLSLGYTEGETKAALSFVANNSDDIKNLSTSSIVKKALTYFNFPSKKH